MQLKKLGEWSPYFTLWAPWRTSDNNVYNNTILQTHTHAIRGKLALAALISISKRVRNTMELSALQEKVVFVNIYEIKSQATIILTPILYCCGRTLAANSSADA